LTKGFVKTSNKKFAVPRRDANGAHRPWTKTEAVRDHALARHEERVLSKALTVCTGGTMDGIKTGGRGTAMRGARATLHRFMNKDIRVHYKVRILVGTAFKTFPMQSPAEDATTIDLRIETVLAARSLQALHKARTRAGITLTRLTPLWGRARARYPSKPHDCKRGHYLWWRNRGHFYCALTTIGFDPPLAHLRLRHFGVQQKRIIHYLTI